MTEHQEHEQDQEPQDPPAESAPTSSSNAFDAIDDYMNSTEEEAPSMGFVRMGGIAKLARVV